MFSRVKLDYAERLAEKWRETLEWTREENRYRHNLTATNREDREAGLSRLGDARYYAQRFLTTEALPAVAYRFSVPWPAFFLAPGDKVHVTYSRFGLDAILEVLDVSYDLVAGAIKVVAGDQRGWGDTFGFWESEADTDAEVPAPTIRLDPEGLAYLPNQSVQNWIDQSGNGIDFTQPAINFQPTYESNAVNGYGCVRFVDGDYLYPTQLLQWTEGEIWVLVKADNDPGAGGDVGNTLWGEQIGNLQNQQRFPDTSGDIQEGIFSDSMHDAGNPTPALTGWRLYNVRSRDGLYEVILDGVTLLSTAVNTFEPHFFFLGGAFGGRWFNGRVAALWAFDRVLNATESAAVQQRFSDRYNLGLVAPSAGPPDWDPTWTDAEVQTAKQNAGYWAGDDSLADSTDPRSYRASRWW